ncbi:MAG TPA: hemolysin family protein [Gemmatimonadota bacterium]|nr:hemolysin family protein [Gemmatimonadota bacterium]
MTWLIILLLVLVNALYVAAEFGSVAVRHSQIRRLAESGNRLAAGLLSVIEDPHRLDRYIACCQIGITLSSLVLGAFGQATVALDLADRLEQRGWGEAAALSTAATGVLLFLTIFQVVFGELLPKSIALQYPSRTALATYLPMVWSLALFRWFIAVLNGSGLILVRLFGFPHGVHRHVHAPEEIEMLIAESADGGLLEPDEQRRLVEALRLSERTARDLMVPRGRVRMIDADAPFEEILRSAISSPYTRLPVYRNSADNVIGLVHIRDLARHVADESAANTLEAVLRPIASVPGPMEIDRLLPVLRSRGQRMALVVDEFGGVEGVVTLQDVLDELVGPEPEESPVDQPRPERLPDGRVRLPGSLRLDEVSKWSGVSWRDEEAITVAGLVLNRLGRLPHPGERVVIDDVEVEVERMGRRAVASLLIRPRPRKPERA